MQKHNLLKRLLLLLVLIIIGFSLIHLKSDGPQKTNNPQSESLNQEIPLTNANQIIKTTAKKFQPISSEQESESPLLIKKNSKNKITFLQAFREFHFFLSCKEVIDDFFEQKDTEQRLERKTRLAKHGLTDVEIFKQYYEIYTAKCLDKLISSDKAFIQMAQRLQGEYLKISPQTDEEKDLFEILQLLEDIRKNQLEVRNVKKGSGKLSEHDDERISSLYKQIKSDKALLFDMLKVTQIADAHLYIFQRNNFYKDFSADMYRDVSVLFKKHAENALGKPQFSSFYGVILKRAVLPLFACALNYPCDQDSLIAWDFCIHQGITSACGQSVESFILNTYISPNIQLDVAAFLNELLNNYAQTK